MNILNEAFEAINDIIQDVIDSGESYTSEQMGFDARAFPRAYIVDDYLVIPFEHLYTANYYAGFEYIRADHVQKVGEFVIYSRENERVDGAIGIIEKEKEAKDGCEG